MQMIGLFLSLNMNITNLPFYQYDNLLSQYLLLALILLDNNLLQVNLNAIIDIFRQTIQATINSDRND